MIKDKNRKVLVGAITAAILLGAGSLAWFTDRTHDVIQGEAGTVTVTEPKDAIYLNMAPGDVEDLDIEATYTGSLDAKVRIRLTDEANEDNEFLTLDENATEGFVIRDPEGNDIDVSEPIEFGVKKTGETVDLDGYTLNFIGESGNEYQNKGFKFNVVVEALQDRNSGKEWELVDSQVIEVLPASEH